MYHLVSGIADKLAKYDQTDTMEDCGPTEKEESGPTYYLPCKQQLNLKNRLSTSDNDGGNEEIKQGSVEGIV